jgi:hypothetical protein
MWPGFEAFVGDFLPPGLKMAVEGFQFMHSQRVRFAKQTFQILHDASPPSLYYSSSVARLLTVYRLPAEAHEPKR